MELTPQVKTMLDELCVKYEVDTGCESTRETMLTAIVRNAYEDKICRVTQEEKMRIEYNTLKLMLKSICDIIIESGYDATELDQMYDEIMNKKVIEE